MASHDPKDDTVIGIPAIPKQTPESIREMKRRYASLIVVEGKEIGREYRLPRLQNVIGRDDDVHIRIVGDRRISRRHARVQAAFDPARKTTEYVVVDLNSTNHTYVNEEETAEHFLVDGDKVRVGDTVLKFMLQDEIDIKFHKEIQRRINYDSLTGLLTRDSFELALSFELDRSRKGGLSLALFMMDLDFFKRVNDTYGHLAGSFVLSEIGKIIQENFRAIDVSARYGGEEFVTYLSEETRRGAVIAAERVRDAVKRQDFEFKDQTIKITISIGISMFADHGDNIETLIAHADKALYRAKNSGRDLVAVYDPSIDK